MVRRASATTLIAFLITISTGVPDASAQRRLHITVQAGAGDNVRAGAITPVEVTLENGLELYDGRVTVAFVARGDELVVATRAVELAPQAKKRVTLYLPASNQVTDVRAAYETPRGPLGWQEVASTAQRIQQVDPEIPAFAGVRAVPRGLPPDRDAQNRAIYRRFFMRLDQAPDQHEGLQMFDALFVSPPPEGSFTGPQVRAVQDWVLRGGILVVDASGRSPAYREGRLGDLMPFIPQGNEQRVLPSFDREMLYAVGSVRDAEILVEAGGVPLVLRRNHGLGSVVVFAVDPADPALLNWEGLPGLWRRILGPLVRAPSEAEPGNIASGSFFGARHGQIANTLAEYVTQAPSTGMRLGMVLLLTALYALVAGPGDYLLVRKLKRPRLTWITFPLIVAFFTLTAYIGARYWIGGDWEVRHAQRMVIFPEQDAALAFDLTGVFVPQGADYHVENASPAMLRHIGDLYGLEDRLRIDGDTGTMVQRIPIWTHRIYVSSQTVTSYPNINVEWSEDDSGYTIRVTNHSDHSIVPRTAMAGETAWSLSHVGDAILPAETRRIVISRERGQSILEYDKESLILTGIATGQPGRSAFGRELNVRDALRRSARIVTFDADGDGSPVRIDGRAIENQASTRVIQVLTYGAAQNDATEHTAPSEV